LCNHRKFLDLNLGNKSNLDMLRCDGRVRQQNNIAPEGTRNATDTLLPFKEGSMKIATKTKIPIIPVCIKGTEEIMENHLPWIHGGNIYIEYGTPVYPDQLEADDKKHIGAYVQNIIQQMYDK